MLSLSKHLLTFNSWCFLGNWSWPYFSVAMQLFSVALWNVNACIAEHMGVAIGLQIFRPYRAGKVVCCSWNWPHPKPLSWQERGEAIRKPYCRAKVSPLRGDLEGSFRLNIENGFTPALFLRGNGAEEAGSGIKARPVNGSGLSALIFFGSFLYQDMKEREKALCHAYLLRCNVSPLLFGMP